MNVKETRRPLINSKIDFIFIISYVIYSVLFYFYVSMMAMPEYEPLIILLMQGLGFLMNDLTVI